MMVDKMKYSGRKFTCDDKNNISSKICYSINNRFHKKIKEQEYDTKITI